MRLVDVEFVARCVSSTLFGLKSAPETKFWGKMVKGPHHEGRLPQE